jgi:hypothetical protein
MLDFETEVEDEMEAIFRRGHVRFAYILEGIEMICSSFTCA